MRAPTHIPFKWEGARGPQFAPVGGVQAFTSEGEKAAALRDTMRQEVQLYKGADANTFLQDKVADEMAKEVAQGVLEEHKARPDRDYNACFQSWLLGKNDVLNNPLITQRGYTSYVEKFPRVINWVDAQVRLASEIKVYLVRLYTEGPATEEEVEHEFRYLVWPLNNALRTLQQARNDPSLPVDVLRGVRGGAWDPQHQTAGGQPWPAELTYMGRVPDPANKDVPPCLHPALNPYMRDQWVYSVSYKEWLAGDYSKLRGDSRELWEVVANRLYGRNDRFKRPQDDAEDPQQQVEWLGEARPEGAWGAAREAKACGRVVMPATQRPLVPLDRPWLPANPVPSAPEAGEDEEEGVAEGNPEITADDVAEAVRERDGEGEKKDEVTYPDLKAPSREQFFEQISQNTDAMRDMIKAVRDMLDAQTRGLTQAPKGSVPGAFPEDNGAAGGHDEHPDLPVVVGKGDGILDTVSLDSRQARKDREEAAAAAAAKQTSLLEEVAGAMARLAGNAAAAGAQAVGSAAASAVRSLLAAPSAYAEDDGAAPAATADDWAPLERVEENGTAATRTPKRTPKADEDTVASGRAFAGNLPAKRGGRQDLPPS